MMLRLSRRDFLRTSSVALCAASPPATTPSTRVRRGPYTGALCLFSKPLPQMEWRPLAQAAKRLGFGGIDLTVRPGGHVRPERAAEDLPKAVSIVREEGLDVPMIATALTSAGDPTARPILLTATKLSIPFFKLPGLTAAEREASALRAAQHDLDFLKSRVREAYGAV